MVSIGCKALRLRRRKSLGLPEGSLLAGEHIISQDKVGRKRKMGRKERKKHSGRHGNPAAENQARGMPGATFKAQKTAKDKTGNVSPTSFVRKQLDPETAKYFTEIANVIEGSEIELEERSAICSNALEEARGKEVELTTDYILSHTMQTLLEGCSVDHLCTFLQSSAANLSHIANDRSGSHVVETALKSLVMHLQDSDSYSLIEETLTALCQALVVSSVDIMCNCYGSHVLRRLLCLCKGVPLDSSEFHGTKRSTVLAKRLNLRSPQLEGDELQQNQSFPGQLKFLISEMVNPLRVDIATVQVNQYGSLVLQTALKLLAGQDEELSHIIPVLLGCRMDNGFVIEVTTVKQILRLVEENSYSHLMEVILAVSPEAIYNEIITKVFTGSLFKMSSHPCGNFVVQALVSHARSHEHIKLIWEELGAKFKNLFEMGRSGVVSALLAASQRLQFYEHKCCQALIDAVGPTNEPSASIIPRILYIDNYFYSNDKANWSWPNGVKISVLGSLMLQSVFKLPSEFIQAYITSIVSLEVNHVLEVSKDPTGNRVIEAFLGSYASAKQKRKLVIKLQGHFGELSVHPSGSFIIDKCFDASNVSLRETIVSELLPVQAVLSKTKQGPYLLKKLDVEGFAKRSDQWRSRQMSKESTYNEFYAAFGPKETKSSRSENFLADTRHKSQPETLKGMRNEIDTFLSSGSPSLAHQGSTKPKRPVNKRVPENAVFSKDVANDDFIKSKSKRRKMENADSFTENTIGGEILHREKSSTVKNENKRRKKYGF